MRKLCQSLLSALFVILPISDSSADASPTWYMDISQDSKISGTIFLCARPSLNKDDTVKGWLPGHAYIAIKEDNGSSFEAIGAYPTEDYKYQGLFSKGKLKPEYASIKGEDCLVLSSNQNQLDAANRVIIEFSQSPKYVLLYSDCVSLLRKVGIEIGIKIPLRIKTLSPKYLIKSIASKNGLTETG